MNAKTYNIIFLRTLCLLLMAVGAGGAWGQGYFLSLQNYDGVSPVCDWISDNTGRYTATVTSGYVSVAPVSNGGNGTRVYTPITNVVTAGVSYILQFDIKIKGGTNHPSWFQVNDATNTPVYTGGSAANTTATSILQLAQTAAGGTTWKINGDDDQTVTLDATTWYTFRLHKTADKTFLTIIDRDASSVLSGFNDVEITTNSIAGGLGNMEFATKRYSSSLAIDNVSVQKWGWDVIGHTVNLTAANNDNKITSGMPTLYNPADAAVAYSYDGTVISNYASEYPPRLKTTGTGTVTADIGGRKSTYMLYVNSPMGGGTYNSGSNTYTFDRVGVLPNNTVADVTGVTMTADGGPTAIVVNDGTRNVLKVIDGNGFSHPFNTANAYPTMGTYYRFVPTANGTLTVFGTFSTPTLHTTSSKTNLLTTDGDNYKADLVIGNTYYLYNSGSTPMLNWFRYTLSNTTLTFRNPQPVITVDAAEGSYTNPAISASGKPISYSILSGSASVNAEGKVTFSNALFLNPAPIVVQATAGTETAAYTINVVKRTWIFSDKSKWSTESTSLTGGGWQTGQQYSGNGLSGNDQFCRNTMAMDYVQLTTNGSSPMPETQGLLFSKTSNNDRLYIAPKDYTASFLAMRASSIAIDEVQAGQVVTVSWTGGNGSAVLDMQDAAGENVTGNKGGTLQLTVTQTGRVQIYSNPIVAYINRISISSPMRAIGTLSYGKLVLSGTETVSRTGYTITDESGLHDLTTAYSDPGSFRSSDPSVVTVDGSGNVTAVSTGQAVITATATAKNSGTHQPTVTLIALVEVVGDAATRIRTIGIEDLLYTTGVSAANGLDRRVPGFDLTFTGGDGAKCNDAASLLLRNSSGQMTITPRTRGSEMVYITKALLSVKSIETGATFTVNGTSTTAEVGGMELSMPDDKQESLVIKSTSTAAFEITAIKLYYKSKEADNADYCLDETKVAPAIAFTDDHLMRVPADGLSFTQTSTLTAGDYFKSFDISYTYASDNTSIATIDNDGQNGQLLASGMATITARFNETKYFASAEAAYTVSNTLLPGESYDIAIAPNSMGDDKKFVHIMAHASKSDTELTLTGTGVTVNAPTLTYGIAQERRNTFAENASTTDDGTVTLKNSTPDRLITIEWIHVVKQNLQKWLYYKDQAENFKEQVQFNSFETGAIAGFCVMDVGDPENPIDLTGAYNLRNDVGDAYTVASSAVLGSLDGSNGNATAINTGTSAVSTTISRVLEKTGQADGYADELTAEATVIVLPFAADKPVEWTFVNNVANASNTMGYGWTYDDRGFQYGYFGDYTPILDNTNEAYAPSDNKQMHGIMLKDEFRWYAAETTRGLRANLSQPRSCIKFPVKEGMEIEFEVATSSADVNHIITNVTDIEHNPTSTLFIQAEGHANPITARFIAASNGCVELKSTDRVGMYLKRITLKVPEIHFTDDIVTVLTTGDDGAGHVVNATTNVPSSSLQYLNYEILSGNSIDDDGNEEVLPDVSTLATIDNTDESETKGRVTLTGAKGWITVQVTNTNPSLAALEPKQGTYKLYAVDFRFDPSSETIDLDTNDDKEVDFSRRPVGINKVATPIYYSMEIPSGSTARAMMKQTTNANPALTTYLLTAYGIGTINVIAQTGRITAQCALTVTGHTFEKVVDVLSESDIADNDYIYTINLPDYYNADNSAQWSLAWAYEGEFPQTPDVTLDLTIPDGLTGDARAAYPGKLKIKDLYGTSATKRNHGAIRFIATYNDGVNGDKYTQFVLTLSYPASSGKKWDFFRSATGLKAQADHDDKIDDYVGTHLNEQSVSSYTITGTGKTGTGTHWTTDASWNKIYRNGDKEPRWAYGGSVKCDNAFIIEETAGLLIETSPNSFYVDNNATAAYCHVGIHSHGKVTIPSLKAGDFVSLNLSRVIPNSGAILKATNVKDLRGMPVTESFTITRSQIDKPDKPGYYTFQVMNDGDVSFTLEDEGYLDILSVEIYNGTYRHTLKDVKLSQSPDYPTAPMYILKESAEEDSLTLAFCHPMGSTSVGPAEYVLKGINPDEVGQNLASYEMKYYVDDETQATLDREHQNLTIGLEKDPWQSPGGVWYENGKLRIGRGYGKITVRMNNYTAEGRYLIGYSPDYTLTVGHKPHQTYPYTWDFTNISGGESKNKRNNADSSVANDETTWVDRGDNVYELNTNTNGGSLYVPGATLVTLDRDLGEDGTKDYLDGRDHGVDEFNGLGINGWLMFKGEATGVSAKRRAPRRVAAAVGTVELLSYKMDDPNYDITTVLPAGNGSIYFGRDRRETSALAACGYAFRLDDGNTKFIKLMPMRAFKAGDIIKVKAYQGNIKLCKKEKDKNDTALKTFDCTSSEAEYTYTVTADDGIDGLSSLCIYRNTSTSLITEVSITGNYYEPEVRALYAVAPTTITIPDLNADGKQDWIYIHASKTPLSITNATEAVAADGLDAKDEHIYKYKVTAPGNSEVTFAGDAEIYKIGVTHILKDIAEVGGKGWATESRDHSIDHSLTGYFTVNDVNAYGVMASEYDDNVTKVSLVPIAEDGYVPENTGLVLKLNETANLSKANSGNKVPLFYPSYTAVQSSTTVDFPAANLMRPNVTARLFTNERENADGTEADDADYYRFILAKRYMTWKKTDGTLNTPTEFESKDAAVFYRMHYYTTDADGKTANQLNTLGANKAYLLLPADKLPAPLWEEPVAPAPQRYIGIVGESDMADDILSVQADAPTFGDGKTYNLRGQLVTDDGRLPSGIYIRNGRKVVIK